MDLSSWISIKCVHFCLIFIASTLVQTTIVSYLCSLVISWLWHPSDTLFTLLSGCSFQKHSLITNSKLETLAWILRQPELSQNQEQQRKCTDTTVSFPKLPIVLLPEQFERLIFGAGKLVFDQLECYCWLEGFVLVFKFSYFHISFIYFFIFNMFIGV